MKTLAQAVIGSDGHLSIWADLTAALNYAVRCHGVLHELVTKIEAECEAKAAFERGKAEGIALSHLSGFGSPASSCQSSSCSPVCVNK